MHVSRKIAIGGIIIFIVQQLFVLVQYTKIGLNTLLYAEENVDFFLNQTTSSRSDVPTLQEQPVALENTAANRETKPTVEVAPAASTASTPTESVTSEAISKVVATPLSSMAHNKSNSSLLPVQRQSSKSRVAAVGDIRMDPFKLDDYVSLPDVDGSEITSSITSDEFAFITAGSNDHFLEMVSMLRTLLRVNYTGHLFIYAMHLPEEKDSEELQDFVNAVKQSSFFSNRTELILYEVPDRGHFQSFCWKPSVIADALSRSKNLKVIMWGDSSTRFYGEPINFANKFWNDGLDFAGRNEILGMGENTHDDTYKFLNMSKNDYKQYHEIVATQFIMNVGRRNSTARDVLERWIDCAVNHCRACMAPDLNTRNGRLKFKRGPPSDVYIIPRQDQAVLGLLLYEKIRNGFQDKIKKGTYKSTRKYMEVTTNKGRDEDVTRISDLYRSPELQNATNTNPTAEDFCPYCLYSHYKSFSCEKRKEYLRQRYRLSETQAREALVKDTARCIK